MPPSQSSFVRKWIAPTALAALVGMGWTLNAVARQSAKPAAPPDAKPPSSQTKSADQEKYFDLTIKDDLLQNEKTGEYSGRNFTFKQDDLTVTGTTARYNDKTKVLLAEGNLVMEDPKYRITAQKANVDNSKKKLAILTGSVVIVLKPSDNKPPDNGKAAPVGVAPIVVPGQTAPPADTPPDGEKKRENVGDNRKRGGTITCDRVEAFYKRKFNILRGNLIFKQRIQQSDGKMVERTLTAEHAEYDEKADKLTLFAPVQGQDTNSQTVRFQGNVIVGTKEGEETLASPNGITLHALVEEDNEEGTPEKVPPPKKPEKKE